MLFSHEHLWREPFFPPISKTSIDIKQHFDYLQKTGFYTEKHREFLDRAVLKFPGTTPLVEEYFKSTDALTTNYGFTFVDTPTGPTVRIDKPVATVISEDVTIKAAEPSPVNGAMKVEEPATSVVADVVEVRSLHCLAAYTQS